jgi:predicted nucleic acid-binding protein
MALIYFDTSVFIRHFIGDPSITESQVDLQFKRINSGQDTAVVSYLVLLEVVEVIRKRIIQREHFNGDGQEEIDKIKEKVNSKVKEFMSYVKQLSYEGKLQILNSKISFEEHLVHSLNELMSISYNIYNFNKCSVCRHPINPEYSFKGLGQVDIQHAVIAKNIQCDEFVSADQWFKTLIGKKEFEGIKITTIR